MRKSIPVPIICFFGCCLILLAACDDSFQPLQENDTYHFSIYGYLDASADTQWVRVGTVRQDILEPPDPTGIQVTLEHVQSGQMVVMNDSVFAAGNVLNYRTTMDIKPEQTYRITAEGAGGNSSRVTVTTPEELPSIFIVENDDPIENTIYIRDTAHIVDLQSVWYVILNPETENRKRIYRFPLRKLLQHTFSFFGAYSTTVIYEEELAQIEQSAGNVEILVVARQFFVASGGPEWDENFSSITDLEYFLDGTAANVENGLGYVVGIDAKWFRQEQCVNQEESEFTPCIPDDGPYW